MHLEFCSSLLIATILFGCPEPAPGGAADVAVLQDADAGRSDAGADSDAGTDSDVTNPASWCGATALPAPSRIASTTEPDGASVEIAGAVVRVPAGATEFAEPWSVEVSLVDNPSPLGLSLDYFVNGPPGVTFEITLPSCAPGCEVVQHTPVAVAPTPARIPRPANAPVMLERGHVALFLDPTCDALPFAAQQLDLGDTNVPQTGPETRALNGIDGAPIPVVALGHDVSAWYGRKKAMDPLFTPNGAQTRMVRVGADVSCDRTLEALFTDAGADPDVAQSYDFGALDEAVAAAHDLDTGSVMWQPSIALGQPCSAVEGVQSGTAFTDLDSLRTWQTVVFNTLQTLRGDLWTVPSGGSSRLDHLEFPGDPATRLGVATQQDAPQWQLYLDGYAALAGDVSQGYSPDVVSVGCCSFDVDPNSAIGDDAPAVRFIEGTALRAAPLDFLSVAFVHVTDPSSVRARLEELRQHLDDAGYPDTELIVTGVTLDPALVTAGDANANNSRRGAFWTAVRMEIQGLATHMLATRGPWVYDNLKSGTALPSHLFDDVGEMRPAMTMQYQLWTLEGSTAVHVATDMTTRTTTGVFRRAPSDRLTFIVAAWGAHDDPPIAYRVGLDAVYSAVVSDLAVLHADDAFPTLGDFGYILQPPGAHSVTFEAAD